MSYEPEFTDIISGFSGRPTTTTLLQVQYTAYRERTPTQYHSRLNAYVWVVQYLYEIYVVLLRVLNKLQHAKNLTQYQQQLCLKCDITMGDVGTSD